MLETSRPGRKAQPSERAKGAEKALCRETIVQKGVFGESFLFFLSATLRIFSIENEHFKPRMKISSQFLLCPSRFALETLEILTGAEKKEGLSKNTLLESPFLRTTPSLLLQRAPKQIQMFARTAGRGLIDSNYGARTCGVGKGADACACSSALSAPGTMPGANLSVRFLVGGA